LRCASDFSEHRIWIKYSSPEHSIQPGTHLHTRIHGPYLSSPPKAANHTSHTHPHTQYIMSASSQANVPTSKLQDNKEQGGEAVKDAQKSAPVLLEEDDEFEDFPVEGQSRTSHAFSSTMPRWRFDAVLNVVERQGIC
jgi:hypothetical protein